MTRASMIPVALVVLLLVLGLCASCSTDVESMPTMDSVGIGATQEDWEGRYRKVARPGSLTTYYAIQEQWTASVRFSGENKTPRRVIAIEAWLDAQQSSHAPSAIADFAKTLVPSDVMEGELRYFVYPGRRVVTQDFTSTSLAALSRYYCQGVQEEARVGRVDLLQNLAVGPGGSRHFNLAWECAYRSGGTGG